MDCCSIIGVTSGGLATSRAPSILETLDKWLEQLLLLLLLQSSLFLDLE